MGNDLRSNTHQFVLLLYIELVVGRRKKRLVLFPFQWRHAWLALYRYLTFLCIPALFIHIYLGFIVNKCEWLWVFVVVKG